MAKASASFTKQTPYAAGYYPAEAAGLAWLAAAGSGSVPVVGVRRVDEDEIVLDRLVSSTPTRRAAEDFGRSLAVTHAAGAAAFGQGPDGWTGDGFLGRQRLTLRPQATWGAFYAEQRLWPYAVEANARHNLSPAGLRAVHRVCERLVAGDFDDDRPPARIHGDLWTGNVIYTDSGATLIDPAAHGGHGLTDLAMLHLFGAPHLERTTAAYAKAAGLSPGWPELIALHQLHPLLVHAVSHSAAYGSQAEAGAKHYL